MGDIAVSDVVVSEQTALYTAVSDHPKPCHYSVTQRIQAATLFVTKGSLRKVAKLLNIPHKTIDYWRQNSPWWNDMCAHVRTEKSHEMDALQSEIINLAHMETRDRLINGNETIDKHGKKQRVKMTGRDSMMIAAIAYDKRQLNRMLPTTIRASGIDVLAQLATQLIDLKRNQQPAITVDRVDDDAK